MGPVAAGPRVLTLGQDHWLCSIISSSRWSGLLILHLHLIAHRFLPPLPSLPAGGCSSLLAHPHVPPTPARLSVSSFCKLHRCHPRPDSCTRLGSSSLPLCMKLPNCPTWHSRSSANSVFLLDNSCIFHLSDKCGSRAFYVCQARHQA